MDAPAAMEPIGYPGGIDFSAQADCDLNIEERVERMIQENESRAINAWTMMPKLFEIWDADSSGELDKGEVFLGVEQYCEAREIPFDSRMIAQLWSNVDDNGDGVLDRHEFSVFLARYCEAVGVPLDDVAVTLLDKLSNGNQEQSMNDHSSGSATSNSSDRRRSFSQAQIKPPGSEGSDENNVVQNWIASITGGGKASKQATWADLKVESEKIHEQPQGWEGFKQRFTINPKPPATRQQQKQQSANVWHQLDSSLTVQKKKIEDAFDLSKLMPKKTEPSPPAPVTVHQPVVREEEKIRPLAKAKKDRSSSTKGKKSKIQATSLDGFFSSVQMQVQDNNTRSSGSVGTSSYNSSLNNSVDKSRKEKTRRGSTTKQENGGRRRSSTSKPQSKVSPKNYHEYAEESGNQQNLQARRYD